MPLITIEVTETQYKGLESIALSVEEWVDNFVTDRARIAVDEIVKDTVTYCLDNNKQIPANRDDIVEYAFANDIVEICAVRVAREEIEAQARFNEEMEKEEMGEDDTAE